ncbi:MAG: FAD-binding oxidoreductase [Bacteroidetes bacterium]|nr:FAD-binding oxidoreductase [Bacteroidota bacterium]
MFSYWEQQSFADYQHIVIGAGIVGLSTAIELKEKYPKASVLVLERGLLPTGASTRNAGFACMGSVTELLDDLQHMNEDEVVMLYEWRELGLRLLRKRLGDEKIGYAANGSYELISEAEIEALNKIDYLNELLHPVMAQKAFKLANHKIVEYGFSPSYTEALIENICEGELNSGMMMKALMAYAMHCGVEVKTGAEVVRFEEVGHKVNVEVKDPFRNEIWPLTCDTLSICTNAFTKKLLPEVDVTPGRGQILITDPINGLKFKGVYHFDKGYYYFREIDGRVLLGGGRNLDFKAEATHSFDLNERIQSDLEQKLKEIILPDTEFTIAQRWAGIMAFGENKYPVVKAFSQRIYGAFRMGGMGVALGSEVARRLAELHHC